MSQSAVIAFCWIALAVTGLVFVGGAAIGAAYYPEQGLSYLVTSLAPVVLIAGLLGLFSRTEGMASLLVSFVIACAGVALVGVFSYRLAVDRGDALLWTPPLVLGLGLLVLLLSFGRNAEKRGST
jgi:hypothetical protein